MLKSPVLIAIIVVGIIIFLALIVMYLRSRGPKETDSRTMLVNINSSLDDIMSRVDSLESQRKAGEITESPMEMSRAASDDVDDFLSQFDSVVPTVGEGQVATDAFGVQDSEAGVSNDDFWDDFDRPLKKLDGHDRQTQASLKPRSDRPMRLSRQTLVPQDEEQEKFHEEVRRHTVQHVYQQEDVSRPQPNSGMPQYTEAPARQPLQRDTFVQPLFVSANQRGQQADPVPAITRPVPPVMREPQIPVAEPKVQFIQPTFQSAQSRMAQPVPQPIPTQSANQPAESALKPAYQSVPPTPQVTYQPPQPAPQAQYQQQQPAPQAQYQPPQPAPQAQYQSQSASQAQYQPQQPAPQAQCQPPQPAPQAQYQPQQPAPQAQYQAQPAPQAQYQAQPAPQAQYQSPKPVSQAQYQPQQPAPQAQYQPQQPASQAQYQPQHPAPQTQYQPQPAPQTQYQAQPAPQPKPVQPTPQPRPVQPAPQPRPVQPAPRPKPAPQPAPRQETFVIPEFMQSQQKPVETPAGEIKYTDRNSGMDKQGRSYSVEELMQQIK